jgi:hypothetical protein
VASEILAVGPIQQQDLDGLSLATVVKQESI